MMIKRISSRLFLVVMAAGLTGWSCAAGKRVMEDPPIITSATYQHTQYNGRAQPVEAIAAKEDAPPPIITYFQSEDDLEHGFNGASTAPSEVGGYYVLIERPAGNGYRQGKNIKIEYHIQKAFVSIIAEDIQRFGYDGKPKMAEASMEPPMPPALLLSYFATDNHTPLAVPPSERGVYRVTVSFPGNERYMGTSRDLTMIIE
jgi:hypothetical protein